MTYRSLSSWKLFRFLGAALIVFDVGGAVSGQPPGRGPAAGQAVSGSTVGVPVAGERGIRRTTAEMMAAQQDAPPPGGPLLMHEHEIEGLKDRPQNPDAKPVASLPGLGDGGTKHAAGNVVIAAADVPAPSAPQTIGLNFDALTGPAETGAFPPDTMGAAGPSQLFLFVNGRLRTFNKTTGTADGVINVHPNAFFSSVMTPVSPRSW